MSARARYERADFFTRLRRSFADEGVPLSLIELEFTESAAMEVSEAVLSEIASLRADGATIAIDDFGTGYSNLARLRTMPLDRVKLDPSLIAAIEDCERARVIAIRDPADPRSRLRMWRGCRNLGPADSGGRWAATSSRALSLPSDFEEDSSMDHPMRPGLSIGRLVVVRGFALGIAIRRFICNDSRRRS